MAGVLRPPQFSEETAWLPPWLQPHHTAHIDGCLDDQFLSTHILKCSTSYRENLHGKEASHSPIETNCKYSSCRLFLSEGSDSLDGSIPSPQNDTDLDLHLSSEGISQIPSDVPTGHIGTGLLASTELSAREFLAQTLVGLNGICQSRVVDHTDDKNLLVRSCTSAAHTSKEYIYETTCSRNRLNHQGKMTNELRKGRAKGLLKPFQGPSKDIPEGKKQTEKRSKRPQLKVADVDEAVELCVAASEAVVISELAGCNDNSGVLSTTAILGVALQVKQARKQCPSEVQATSQPQSQQTNEIDELSDLDDSDMEEAFDDVGITVTQIIPTYGSTGGICSPRNYSHTRSPYMELNNDLLSRMSPSNADFSRPDQIPGVIQNLQNEIKNSKVEDAIRSEKYINSGRTRFFPTEISTISESIDTVGESTSIQLPRTDSPLAPFSTKMSDGASISSSDQNKRTTDAEILLSQDFVGSSTFSLIDPLCSVVPCSLPLDNSICDKETLGEVIGCAEPVSSGIRSPISCDEILGNSLRPAEPVSSDILFPNLHPKTVVINDDNMARLPSFEKSVEACSSNYKAEIAGVTFKRSNSLKSYSMEVPTGCNNLSTGVGSPESKSSHLLEYSIVKISSDGLQNKRSYCKMTEEAGFTSTTAEVGREAPELPSSKFSTAVNAVISTELEKHNDKRCRCSILHNNGQHCDMVRSMIINGNQDTNVKVSTSKTRRKGMNSSNNHAPYHDGAVIKSCLSHRSNIHSITLKELKSASKRVRFSTSEPDKNQIAKAAFGQENCSNGRSSRKKKLSYRQSLRNGSNSLTGSYINFGNNMIFHGLQFLVTGFTNQKKIEVENIIRMYGGVVLPSIPRIFNLGRKRGQQFPNQQHQIVVSSKKVQTIEFLYGCAINTWILSANWLSDSVGAGFLLPPEKYLILPHLGSHVKHFKIARMQHQMDKEDYIFYKLGVMLHGKSSFCSRYSSVIKHGGGQVFRSLELLIQSLKGNNSIGAVIVEDDNTVSRHLKHCALEHNIPTVSVNWIVNSLFSGKLLPLKRDRSTALRKIKMPTFPNTREVDMSEEI